MGILLPGMIDNDLAPRPQPHAENMGNGRLKRIPECKSKFSRRAIESHQHEVFRVMMMCLSKSTLQP